MTDSPKSEDPNNADTSSTSIKTKTESKPAAMPPPAPAAEPVSQAPVANNKGSGKGLSVFAILLSFLALAGAGYTWYENNFKRFQQDSKLAVGVAEIGGQVTRLGDSIARLQTQQSDGVSQEQLTTKILEANSAVDLRIRDLNDGQDSLLSAVEKINSEMQTGVNSFVVDEVSQLLKLANNSALFSGDAESAINALKLADLQLKEMADPRFSIVRRKINEEIGVLSGIEQIDVESLTVQLQALAARVPSLKLENERPDVVEDIKLEANLPAENISFYEGIKEVFVDIFNYADIQRVEQAPKPLLAPEQRYFLDQNLQLQLAKAELGALQSRPQVYSQSLIAAEQWINEYFDISDESVKDVLSQLRALKTQSIQVELPAVSGSYDLLQSIKGGQ